MGSDSLSTTDRLLALLLTHDMHDASQEKKIVTLSRAGLSNADVAEILGTTPGVVKQSIYKSKQKRSAKKPKRARKTRQR